MCIIYFEMQQTTKDVASNVLSFVSVFKVVNSQTYVKRQTELKNETWIIVHDDNSCGRVLIKQIELVLNGES